MTDSNAGKTAAALAAADRVQSGMRLGLGTGSTAKLFVDEVGRRVREGLLRDLVGVATSAATARQAVELGIKLVAEDDCPELDLAVDGADEVDAAWNLVKGRGGALLREKIVASHAREFLVVVDESKLVDALGSTGAIPLEVVPFAWRSNARLLEGYGEPVLRRLGDANYVTDNGNFIIDLFVPGGLSRPADLADRLRDRPGVVEHGLFLGFATGVLVGADGGVRELMKA